MGTALALLKIACVVSGRPFDPASDLDIGMGLICILTALICAAHWLWAKWQEAGREGTPDS